MEIEADQSNHSQSNNSKHVRINQEVSYKDPEPLSWTSMESADSSDSASMVLFFGDKDVLKTPRVKKAEKHNFGLQKGRSSSEKVSLPVQSSGKPPLGYDPNRIPAFVFSSKPATPQDWSVNSNESLFSIHMGNNSFSQDLPILLAKSQELGRFEYPSANFSSNLSSVSEATEHTRKASGEKDESTEALIVAPIQNEDDKIYQNISEESHIRKESNEAYVSTPVESEKSVAPNQSDKLSDEDRTETYVKIEVATERQQSLPQTPRLKQKAIGCRWFSCFSCLPRCSCRRPLCCR